MEIILNEYKTTEFGLIPSDWQIKEFQDVMTGFFSGATPYRGLPEYYKGHIYWITSGELDYNVITDTIEKITEEAVRNTNLKILPKGTFLFAITGLEAEGTRGSCAITGVDSTTNQSCMALFPLEKLDVNYLYHYYVWIGKPLALRYCQGTKQQSYTGKIVRNLPIILPPTKSEQTAIATALSDTDALIENLEKLIAKKRNIKQGVLWALLKPQESWISRPIGHFADLYQPETISQEQFTNDGYLVYGANGIVGRYFKYNHEYWQTTITCRGSTCGTVNRTVAKCWITGNAMVINVDKNSNIDKLFFYYLLSRQDFKICITGSGQPQIIRKPLAEFKISVPQEKQEQKRIANIFSAIDFEIETLEHKLHKYKMIKQGMMQSLLTGKIRLV